MTTDLFCVELCSGTPKRDFEFYVGFSNGTAIGNFNCLHPNINFDSTYLSMCILVDVSEWSNSRLMSQVSTTIS